jgi:16S rRNA (guanine527-N7)-methyltransferase
MPVPAPPRAARELFGSRLPEAEAYAELLARAGVERGLIGPGEAARIWDRHLINSGLVAALVPRRPWEAEPIELADLGSGAGLPGIVLAILRPDIAVLLVEPMARRTAFLAECAEELGLGNVKVRRGRAEDLAGQIHADVVTARAVARLDRLAALAASVARPGGLVLAIKGASAEAELDDARPLLRRMGVTDVELLRVGTGLVEQPTTVVSFRTARNARLEEKHMKRAISRRRGAST